jgi:hypothetical protein
MMFSRMFFAVVGLGAGVALGVWTIRKIEAAGQQLSPDALVSRAGERASGLGLRLNEALEVGRAAAQEREAELRAEFLNGSGSGHDALR